MAFKNIYMNIQYVSSLSTFWLDILEVPTYYPLRRHYQFLVIKNDLK